MEFKSFDRRARRILLLVLGLLFVWGVVAYVAMPDFWRTYYHRHPELDDLPDRTLAGDGVPGDPLNVALIGSEEDVDALLVAAKWRKADPLSLESSLDIAEASVFKRDYDAAPVSSLYLFGRKEDLAFEQLVGGDPRHRHHVRFWKTDRLDGDGRPVWVGSAVYDEHVGLSRTTGQITHVTSPDVDKERDYLFQCCENSGRMIERYEIEHFHKVLAGKNGGGDPWRTDGMLYVGVSEAVH